MEKAGAARRDPCPKPSAVNKLHVRGLPAKQILKNDRGRLARQIMKVWEAKETAENIRAYVARTFKKP
jgi:hypothetical protein